MYTDFPRTLHAEVPGLNLGSVPDIWRTADLPRFFRGWTDQDYILYLDFFLMVSTVE